MKKHKSSKQSGRVEIHKIMKHIAKTTKLRKELFAGEAKRRASNLMHIAETMPKTEKSIFKEPDWGIPENSPAIKTGLFSADKIKKNLSNFFEKFKKRPIKEVEAEEKAGNLSGNEIVELRDTKTLEHKKKKESLSYDDLVELEKKKKDEDLFSSPDTPEEAIGRSIDTLTQPKNIKHFTELSDNEIKALSALTAANRTLKIQSLDHFISEFDNRRVSLNRQGRTEIVDLGKAALSPMGGDNGKGLLAKFGIK